jgi:hypothetical protein
MVFFVIGLFGNIFIHIFPLFFIFLAKATLVASICLDVIQVDSNALIPKSPNDKDEPLCDSPFILPF